MPEVRISFAASLTALVHEAKNAAGLDVIYVHLNRRPEAADGDLPPRGQDDFDISDTGKLCPICSGESTGVVVDHALTGLDGRGKLHSGTSDSSVSKGQPYRTCELAGDDSNA